VVCSSDAISTLGFTVSCKKFVAHIGDAYLRSGEIAQRHAENKERPLGGPADLINVITFEPKNEPQVVWSAGDVKVGAIRSSHIPGNESYRVDTPAGSVVIGGDAGNDLVAPPRATSTSDQVETLAKGVDIIVHTTMHPVMGPDRTAGCHRRFIIARATPGSGALANGGAKHSCHTWAAPLGETLRPLQDSRRPLTEADYRKAVEAGGFTETLSSGPISQAFAYRRNEQGF
jgi:ribonuclease Z